MAEENCPLRRNKQGAQEVLKGQGVGFPLGKSSPGVNLTEGSNIPCS